MALQKRALDEAEKAARQAIAIQQKLSNDEQPLDDTHILDTLALVLFEQGKLEEAKTLASQCTTRATGQSLENYDHLGDILWALNDHDSAKAVWEKGLAIASDTASDNRRAKKVREKLSR